jgi:hypothetical protein
MQIIIRHRVTHGLVERSTNDTIGRSPKVMCSWNRSSNAYKNGIKVASTERQSASASAHPATILCHTSRSSQMHFWLVVTLFAGVAASSTTGSVAPAGRNEDHVVKVDVLHSHEHLAVTKHVGMQWHNVRISSKCTVVADRLTIVFR